MKACTLRVYTAEEFEALTDTEPKGWRVEGVFPAAGVVLLAAHALVGKTRLIAVLAALMQVIGGTLAGLAVMPGRLMITHLEHRGGDLAALLKAAARGAGLDRSPALVVEGVDLDSDANVAALAKLADEHEVDVLVIDPIRAGTQRDEDSSGEVNMLRRVTKVLSGDGRRLVILVHHLSHAGNPRGSTDWSAQVDSVVKLRKLSGGVELSVEHHGAPPLRIRLQYDHDAEAGTLKIERVGGQQDSGGGRVKRQEAAVEAIRAEPGMATDAVRKKIGADKNDIKPLLEELEKDGRIENRGGVGQGRPACWHVLSRAGGDA